MKDVLVAYFSATGTTEKVALMLADLANADRFEIKPEVPYSAEDLDWTDKQSRSTVEMNNLQFRPPVATFLPSLDQYHTIYLGFPIWWYVAPTIINTFCEAYDFTGKTVILFATFGGSGFGKTVEHLKDSLKGAQIIEGRIVKSDSDLDTLLEL